MYRAAANRYAQFSPQVTRYSYSICGYFARAQIDNTKMDREHPDRGNRLYRTHARSASWTLARNASGLVTTLEPLRTAFVELTGLSAATTHSTHGGGQSQPVTPAYSSTTSPFESLEQVAYPSTSSNGSLAHRRSDSAASLSSPSYHLPVPASSLGSAPVRSSSSPNFEYETVAVEPRDQNSEGEEAGVEVRLVVRWLQRIIPFLLIFLVKVFWDHRLGWKFVLIN